MQKNGGLTIMFTEKRWCTLSILYPITCGSIRGWWQNWVVPPAHWLPQWRIFHRRQANVTALVRLGVYMSSVNSQPKHDRPDSIYVWRAGAGHKDITKLYLCPYLRLLVAEEERVTMTDFWFNPWFSSHNTCVTFLGVLLHLKEIY